MLMKKFFTLVAATLFTALSLISMKSYGSHAVGADVTYTYVGPNQYLVTVRFYRDCAGITAPTSHIINFTGCGGTFTGSVTLNQIAGSGQQIPPSPCLPTVTTSCNGGSGYGVEEYIYQGLVTLPGPCVDWTFSFSECCRNAQINTVTNPDSYDIYVETTLDNFNYPVNSSPVFTAIPVTQFCVGNQFFYNQGAIDPDGDSLVFSLIPALSNPTLALPYAAGYSAIQPIASIGPITIDPQTGTITFTPSTIQVGVIAVLCQEYRNGVLIGEVRRDIQMNVVGGCIGTAPAFAPPTDPFGNPAPAFTAYCGDTSVYIVLDNPIQCGSVVPTDIRILTPSGQLNPVMTATPINCVNGQTDSILVTFFYPLTVGTTYAFTKVGFDNNTFLSECGVQMPEFDSIPFQVIDPGIFNTELIDVGCSFDEVTITFDYEIVCNTVTSTGSEFVLIDANGTPYPVTSTSNCPGGNGYSATLTFNFGSAISPATPVYLIVQNGTDANTFTNRCATYILPGDTLAVLNVLNNLIVDLGADATICDTDPLPVLDAGLSGATYVWTLDGITLPDQTQTITASVSGTYSVNVNATPSCFGGDSVQVTIVSSPVVTLGSDISLCDTDPIPMLDAGNPGATYQWYENGNPIPSGTNQTYQPIVAGTYSVIVSVGTSCTGTDDVIITTQPSLVVALGLDQTLCSNDPLPILDAGVPNGSYQWFIDGIATGSNTQTLQTTVGGTYSVNVTSLSGCTGSDNYILTVVQTPVVSLTSSVVCPGASFPALDAGNPGATYIWSTGETTQVITPTAAGPYTVTVTNTNNGLNCTATSTASMTNAAPVVVALGSDLGTCEGTSQTFDAGNTNSTYLWSNGATTQQITVNTAGTYIVTVTDANGCTGMDDAILSVNANPIINVGEDHSVCPGEPFPALDATTSNASSYVWTSNGTQVSTSPTYTPTAYGAYQVTIVDNNACVGTDEVVIVEAPCEIEVPNVFTPNGDASNEVFFIKNLDSNPNTQVFIFNRWGNQVYESSNYQNNWDGGGVSDGTYFYTIVLQTGQNYKGAVEIIRGKE